MDALDVSFDEDCDDDELAAPLLAMAMLREVGPTSEAPHNPPVKTLSVLRPFRGRVRNDDPPSQVATVFEMMPPEKQRRVLRRLEVPHSPPPLP